MKDKKYVILNLESARPIITLDGVLHEGGQVYRVLGKHAASFLRLSRVGDNAKLIIEENRTAPTQSKGERNIIRELVVKTTAAKSPEALTTYRFNATPIAMGRLARKLQFEGYKVRFPDSDGSAIETDAPRDIVLKHSSK